MEKNKKKAPTVIVKDAGGETVVTISPRYKNVPIDFETHQGLMRLCVNRGFGQRGQGAMVRMLVKAELARIEVAPDAD